MLETVWIGVDPGNEGALAAILPDGSLVIRDMPTIEEIASRRTMRHIQGIEFRRWLDSLVQKGRLFVGVEKVSPMPGQNVASSGSFMVGYGKIIGILESEMVPFEEVPPQQWQKAILGISRAAAGKGKKLTQKQKNAAKKARKAGSRMKAQQLFPQHADMFARVKDDGRAEAVLIAEHIRRKLTGQTIPEGKAVQLELNVKVAPEVKA